MKKIILLLLTFFSSSFAFYGTPVQKQGNYYIEYANGVQSHCYSITGDYTYQNNGHIFSRTEPIYGIDITDAQSNSTIIHVYWEVNSTLVIDKRSYSNYIPSISNAARADIIDTYYTAKSVNCSNIVPPAPTCSSNEVLVNNVCETIGQQGSCTSGNVVLANTSSLDTGFCSTCTTTQHYDLNLETCVNNCTPTSVQNPQPDNWIDLGFTSQSTCINYLQDTEVNGTFLSSDDGCGGTSSACFGSPNKPCNDLLNPAVGRPVGYVYKGIVDYSSDCSSYVGDMTTYIASSVSPIDNDCSKNNKLYCYLLPRNSADRNNSAPDSTAPNIPLDVNTSVSSDTPADINYTNLNSVDKSNALIGQLTGDFRNYFDWQKKSNGTYEKALTNFGRDFLKGQDTQKMNNANSNANKVANAVNNSSSAITNKLDTLIGTDTTDLSSNTLSNVGDIVSNLKDINVTLPSLSDDNSSSLTYQSVTDSVMSVYADYETTSKTAIDSLIGSIDYGVSDMFNVPVTNFVDYPISLTLPMTTTKLEGNLMSADFLNGLDFTMGRLALLLMTLILSVHYVINRLF